MVCERFNLKGMNTVVSLDAARQRHQVADSSGLFTIKQVSQACGLPGPVIMQLVPRTWVEQVGWLYTREQISAAVAISDDLHRAAELRRAQRFREPIETLSCHRCAVATTVDDAAARGWENVVEPDSSVMADLDGKDYCGECMAPCPTCHADDADNLCDTCFGAGRVPRPPLSTNFVQSQPLRRL